MNLTIIMLPIYLRQSANWKKNTKSQLHIFIITGHNADETAKLMGVSRNAVYKYLRKAEQILFEKLRGDISE